MQPVAQQDLAQRLARAKSLYNSAAFAAARDAFSAIVAQAPNHAESHIYLSHIAWETGDAETSFAALETAARLMPGNARLLLLLAERLGRIGRAEALSVHDRAIACAPTEIKPRADKAHHLQLLGRFDEAEAILRKLIRKHPTEGSLYRMLMAGRTAHKGDPLIREMTAQWRNTGLPPGARVEIGYALAKALDETGSPEKAFAVLRTAKALQRKLYPFDAAGQAAEWTATRAAQDGLPTDPPQADAALSPVFVCGMPRSGTTLVEQIVASHSHATAGGELGHALRLAWQHFGAPPAMQRLVDAAPGALDAWRDRYLSLAGRDTGATRGVFTDKSIQSHLVFGLIRRALPGARLIVVNRDPRDIALSIYRNHFALGTHRYANDLGDIARAIQHFRRSVAHWRDRMPGVIHEIRYEDLVSDPEPQARALVAAAGLDWEDACLRFHESREAVKTLSLAQVRQPIHAGRREAWRRYEAELQPFIEAWGDEPWD